MKNISKWIWVTVILVAICIALFCYKQNVFKLSSSINANRFADFAIFISAFTGFLTIILLYYTYKQTTETHGIVVNTYNQTKSDSTDNKFFNLIQAHHSIVNHLHQRITDELIKNVGALNVQCGSPFEIEKDKDFFELMYRMLHLKYKGKDNPRDFSKVHQFFIDNNWLMGHYFRSLVYFINWIHNNSELTASEKSFYIGFIQAQLTSDEIRSFLYYSLSVENATEKKMLVKSLNEYRFFSVITDPLIYPEDWDELANAIL